MSDDEKVTVQEEPEHHHHGHHVAQVDPLEAAIDVLRRGLLPPTEEEQLAQIAAEAPDGPGNGDGAALRRAAVAYLPTNPQMIEFLSGVEEWSEGEPDAQGALALASNWSLPAAQLDLDRFRHEAVLYLESYPFEGRVIGNLDDRCATWLSQRIAMFVPPSERLPAVRRAIATLADASEDDFPRTSSSLSRIAADVDDEKLWYELSLHITRTEMTRRGIR